jgi:cobalt transporter subunit CbtB
MMTSIGCFTRRQTDREGDVISHSDVAVSDVAVGTTRTRRAAVAVQALVAIAFGLFILGMVGFSPIEAVHNAAHDVRHSNAFPCH